MGDKSSRSVAIVGGYVQRDGKPTNISVGDYTKKNVSSDDHPDPSDNLFHLEPGRCLTQKVYGVNRAHVATSIDVMPICIKRKCL